MINLSRYKALPRRAGLEEAEPGGGMRRGAAQRRRLDLNMARFGNAAHRGQAQGAKRT